MGEKLAPNDLALYRGTDEVLHYIWDPIGVAGCPYARDEYHGYLPRVYSLLIVGDEPGIRTYLLKVTEENIGMTLSKDIRERIDRAVDSLLEWRRKWSEETDLSASSG